MADVEIPSTATRRRTTLFVRRAMFTEPASIEAVKALALGNWEGDCVAHTLRRVPDTALELVLDDFLPGGHAFEAGLSGLDEWSLLTVSGWVVDA